jgi:hypothetical protein
LKFGQKVDRLSPARSAKKSYHRKAVTQQQHLERNLLTTANERNQQMAE